jgi:hypothetical protein
MGYECLRCGFTHYQKNNVRQHIKRKKDCEVVLLNITKEECLRNIENADKDLTIDLMKEEIKKLRKQVIHNKECFTTSGDNNTVNNHSNNNYINITVNSFEKTDYTILKDKIHTCIKNGKVDEAKLIKLLHFNKDAPQNHNIKIENKRENRIKVFNGTDFEDSEYNGKEGIFKFSQDTLNKTGDQEFVENDDKAFDAIEKTKDENYTLNRSEKAQNVGKVSTVIYNGNKLKKKSQLKL